MEIEGLIFLSYVIGYYELFWMSGLAGLSFIGYGGSNTKFGERRNFQR
jgi:hypothetical protein